MCVWSGHAGATAGCGCRVLLEAAPVRGVCTFELGLPVPPHGAAFRLALELACRCRRTVLLLDWLWSWPAGAAGGCRCRVLLQSTIKVASSGVCALEPACRVLSALWNWRAGAVAGCRCKVLLQGAAVGVVCALWSWLADAAAGCCCWVPLQNIYAGCHSQSAVPSGAGLLLPLQGAAPCGCRVLLSTGCLHFRNLGAATGCCCYSPVCAMKLGCWCRCRGWVRNVYGSVGVGP